ncbi:hypothetical protein [Nocardia transvalensis]|uniref:hypothetical protein n=1 Tax=Nocardia transvalensis TaxID=37333 RepID=UPI002B4AC650|nr:hypothetical protein [Nocardia transvalensis]
MAAEPAPAAVIARAGQAAQLAPEADLAAYESALEGLQRLGVMPFLWPSVSPFCSDFTQLGMAPAMAGALPGPWPKRTLVIPGLELAEVQAGHTLFAFVPFGLWPDGPDTSGMHVAWLNTTTGQGGLAPMGPLSKLVSVMVPPQVPPAMRPLAEHLVRTLLFSVLPFGGVRMAPVNTGSGTVLAAIFGTVRNGLKTCFFLPTVGIVSVP